MMATRRQNWSVVLCAFLCLVAARMSPAASYDELIFDAQRYGNTEEKRAAKKVAWDELMARGPEALGEVMKRSQLENVMIGVLAQNMVEQMDPAQTAPILVQSLSSEYPRTRKLAAFFLGWHDTPQYADAVLPLLGDDEAAGAALRTLGKWHVKKAVPDVLPFLRHPREMRRIAGVNALRDIGDPVVVPELMPLLGDDYFTVREAAARALSTFGRPAEHALLEALPTSEGAARRHIIRTLGVMKSRRAAKPLRRLLKDPDPDIRQDVEEALTSITGR